MKLNVGIRRRLAPLVDNDRAKLQLLNALLFSLPGTPIVYYGDEIGMGDNVHLGDRNGVRTPMQWSADRHAGFSTALAEQLYSPVNVDPIYGYQVVNVEAQRRSPSSLLSWMRRVIAARKSTRAFGRGGLRFLAPDNRRVVAYLREHGAETVLVVANLAPSVEAATLDLAEFQGVRPVEMLDGARLPPVGAAPYLFTLAPYGFYWLSLGRRAADGRYGIEASLV
jgi:maltose alpha-D-glucosyltransferase/alpha-amylase